ncbi:unnamed protein product [Lactuca virosa]|uniref:Poor homologous synapsis 1 PH domain-containing protein n=1 Tax=Lactuca virosa TaxID=75947 RepID=A0AAU9NIB3_9ASTR|nr:unnamed protein product [Lactuca virosa]
MEMKGKWIDGVVNTPATVVVFSDEHIFFHTTIHVRWALRSRVCLTHPEEEHYTSKLHFTCHHVSCLLGYPPRGSKIVFMSYKDHVGELRTSSSLIQKDAKKKIVLGLCCPNSPSKKSTQEWGPISSSPAYRNGQLT